MIYNQCISITFRPKFGVTDEQISLILAYLIPRCKFYKFITEKKGEARHLHGICFLKSAKTCTKYFNRDLKKHVLKGIVDELNDGTMFPVCYKGCTVYNDDYLTNYLDKDDDTEEIGSCFPPTKEERTPFYSDVRTNPTNSRS